jgi:hypothetical protein
MIPIASKTAMLSVASLMGLLVLSSSCPSFAWGWNCVHPRRAEVLHRDAYLNAEINHDYGRLNGHFGQLKREDYAIRRQEQRDAYINGGYITPGQQRQLNREENRLQRQINWDY